MTSQGSTYFLFKSFFTDSHSRKNKKNTANSVQQALSGELIKYLRANSPFEPSIQVVYSTMKKKDGQLRLNISQWCWCTTSISWLSVYNTNSGWLS